MDEFDKFFSQNQTTAANSKATDDFDRFFLTVDSAGTKQSNPVIMSDYGSKAESLPVTQADAVQQKNQSSIFTVAKDSPFANAMTDYYGNLIPDTQATAPKAKDSARSDAGQAVYPYASAKTKNDDYHPLVFTKTEIQKDGTTKQVLDRQYSTEKGLFGRFRKEEKEEQVQDTDKRKQWNLEDAQSLWNSLDDTQKLDAYTYYNNVINLDNLNLGQQYTDFKNNQEIEQAKNQVTAFEALAEQNGWNLEHLQEMARRVTAADVTEMMKKQGAEYGHEHPIISSGVSVPMRTIGAVSGLAETGRSILSDYPIDVNSNPIGDFASASRAAVAADLQENFGGALGETVAFGYQTAMSWADSLAAMMIPGGAASWLLGASAGLDAARSALENGASDTEALMSGLTNGIFEKFFESYSIGNFESMKQVPTDAFWKMWLKSAGVEASEELATEFADTMANFLILDEKSDDVIRMNELIAQGYSKEDAAILAVQEAVDRIGLAGIGGALMGTMSASASKLRNTASEWLRNRKSGTKSDTAQSEEKSGSQSAEPMTDEERLKRLQQAGQQLNQTVQEQMQEAEESRRQARQMLGQETSAENQARNTAPVQTAAQPQNQAQNQTPDSSQSTAPEQVTEQKAPETAPEQVRETEETPAEGSQTGESLVEQYLKLVEESPDVYTREMIALENRMTDAEKNEARKRGFEIMRRHSQNQQNNSQTETVRESSSEEASQPEQTETVAPVEESTEVETAPAEQEQADVAESVQEQASVQQQEELNPADFFEVQNDGLTYESYRQAKDNFSGFTRGNDGYYTGTVEQDSDDAEILSALLWREAGIGGRMLGDIRTDDGGVRLSEQEYRSLMDYIDEKLNPTAYLEALEERKQSATESEDSSEHDNNNDNGSSDDSGESEQQEPVTADDIVQSVVSEAEEPDGVLSDEDMDARAFKAGQEAVRRERKEREQSYLEEQAARLKADIIAKKKYTNAGDIVTKQRIQEAEQALKKGLPLKDYIRDAAADLGKTVPELTDRELDSIKKRYENEILIQAAENARNQVLELLDTNPEEIPFIKKKMTEWRNANASHGANDASIKKSAADLSRKNDQMDNLRQELIRRNTPQEQAEARQIAIDLLHKRGIENPSEDNILEMMEAILRGNEHPERESDWYKLKKKAIQSLRSKGKQQTAQAVFNEMIEIETEARFPQRLREIAMRIQDTSANDYMVAYAEANNPSMRPKKNSKGVAYGYNRTALHNATVQKNARALARYDTVGEKNRLRIEVERELKQKRQYHENLRKMPLKTYTPKNDPSQVRSQVAANAENQQADDTIQQNTAPAQPQNQAQNQAPDSNQSATPEQKAPETASEQNQTDTQNGTDGQETAPEQGQKKEDYSQMADYGADIDTSNTPPPSSENLVINPNKGNSFRMFAMDFIQRYGVHTWKKISAAISTLQTMDRVADNVFAGNQKARDAFEQEFLNPVREHERQKTDYINYFVERVNALHLSRARRYNGAVVRDGGNIFFFTKQSAAQEYVTIETAKAEDIGVEADIQIEIRKFSEAELVQLLGEQKIDKAFIDEIGGNYAKIRNAADEFRKIYDDLLSRIQETFERLGMKNIGEIRDYFPHYSDRKVDGVIGMIADVTGFNILTDELPTSINGITETFEPNHRYVANFQKRKGGETGYDVIEGFSRYISVVSDCIFHTADVAKFRALENAIRYEFSSPEDKAAIDRSYYDVMSTYAQKQEQARQGFDDFVEKNTEQGAFVSYLRDYSDYLSGKKLTADRTVERMAGRWLYSLADNVISRLNKNTVGGNLSSAISNLMVLTQSISEQNPLHLARNMIRVCMIGKNGIHTARLTSDFLTARYGTLSIGSTIEELGGGIHGIFEKAGRFAFKPAEFIDSLVAETIWQTAYDDYLKNYDHLEAVHRADDFTRRIMAGRAVGDLPALFQQKNILTRMFTAFQLESNNMIQYMMHDLPVRMKEKYGEEKVLGMLRKWQLGWIAALMRLFFGSYLFNLFSRSVMGRGNAFDPVFEPIEKLYKKDAQAAKEVLLDTICENVPFVDLKNGKVSSAPISTFKRTFKDFLTIPDILKDSNRDSKGKFYDIAWIIARPSIMLFNSVGYGNQFIKTVEGFLALERGGVYKDYNRNYDPETRTGRQLKYDVAPTRLNIAKALVFGQTAVDEYQDYMDSGYKLKSAKFTELDRQVNRLGLSTATLLKMDEALKAIESDKDENGKVVPLSKSKKLKAEIDKAVRGKALRNLLYDYYGVAESVRNK